MPEYQTRTLALRDSLRPLSAYCTKQRQRPDLSAPGMKHVVEVEALMQASRDYYKLVDAARDASIAQANIILRTQPITHERLLEMGFTGNITDCYSIGDEAKATCS